MSDRPKSRQDGGLSSGSFKSWPIIADRLGPDQIYEPGKFVRPFGAFSFVRYHLRMIKRKPHKTIKVSDVAELTGLSSKTVKRLADKHGWTKVRYADGPTATVFLIEKQVLEWIAERQKESDRGIG